VFSALTRPVAEFERDQAAAALPSITETTTLRRIAEQAAARAEAAASKAPADQREERQAEAIARAAEAANLTVPPMPRWLVDDATPEALAGLLASYGRIALLSPEGDVFDQMAGRYNQQVGPNLGVYLKGHAGDLLKVDRRGRPPEYVERPCLTIGLTVQPEVLQGLAGRPGFRGRGLLARFLYSLPESLVGRRQAGAPPVPAAVADRYALELHALAASLTTPAGDDGPALLTLNQEAAELLLAFERDLEPRLAAGSGDLAHLAGWAAKLAGATCRLAALLHLAEHLRDGWNGPIAANTLAGAIRLADYLVEHARAVFDLMGADPRVGDARWLLDWISRTDQVQFSRRDAHQAARGRFRKATDLEPALRLLEEHGYLRRVDPELSQDPHGRGPTRLPPVRGQPLAPILRNHRNHKNPRRARFCGF
jgi:replicative DNA helicase